MKSAAVLFVRPGVAALGEVHVPDRLGPTEVLVRAQRSGLSTGTERWLLTGRFFRAASPVGGERSFPLVPGYQKVGIVERVGSAVMAFAPGDRVFCTTGRVTGGAQARPGGEARGGHLRYSVQDQSEVLSLPPGLDPDAAAGLVLAQVGWNGASRPPVRPGDVAVVLGDGLVGQYAAQTLRARGARTLLVGSRPFRMALARRYSADDVLDRRDGGLPETIERLRQHGPPQPATSLPWQRPAEAALADPRDEGDARGADVVVDTTGARETVQAAAALLRHNGHLVLQGWYPEPENELLEDWLHAREVAAYGTGGWRRRRLLGALDAIVAGRLKTAELVTHRLPVHDAPRAYRDLVLEKREDFLGVVFDWGE
jgi:threonine dehydrogenase-like Zn-dependent dehydrogenase